jgi:predicted RNA-binding protein YlxR (DUF448 family)
MPKTSMVRLYQAQHNETGDHVLRADPTGKGPGRGAYLCRNATAWHDPSSPYRIAAALKRPAGFDAASLAQQLSDLAQTMAQDSALCARTRPEPKDPKGAMTTAGKSQTAASESQDKDAPVGASNAPTDRRDTETQHG